MQKSRWRTIGRKLVINVKKKDFLKRSSELKNLTSTFSNSNTIEIRYYFIGRARTAQWQQHKVSFTLAKSKIFWKNQSVANSFQKMCFRFPNCINVFVQMLSSPIISFRTVKISLQTDDSFRKYFCSLNGIKNGGCRHPLATENLIYKQCELGNKNSNSKVKSTEPTLVQKLVSQKFQTTEAWNLRSDVCILKNTSRNTIQIYSNISRSFFRQILIVFMAKHSQQSSRKMERGPEYVISQLLKQKKEIWKTSSHAAIFFSRYEQWKTKHRFSGKFALTFPILFVYGKQVRGKSFEYCCHKRKLLSYFDQWFYWWNWKLLY